VDWWYQHILGIRVLVSRQQGRPNSAYHLAAYARARRALCCETEGQGKQSILVVRRFLDNGYCPTSVQDATIKWHSHCAPYGAARADFAALIAPVSISLFDAGAQCECPFTCERCSKTARHLTPLKALPNL